ncbi:MAG: hypothetical protein ABI977_05565 [Acidobacteriota bacterium]
MSKNNSGVNRKSSAKKGSQRERERSIMSPEYRQSLVNPKAYSEVMTQLTVEANKKAAKILKKKTISLELAQFVIRTILVGQLPQLPDGPTLDRINQQIDEMLVYWNLMVFTRHRGPRDPVTWTFYRSYRQLRIERGWALREPSRSVAGTICKDAWQLAEREECVNKQIEKEKTYGRKALSNWRTDIELQARSSFNEEMKPLKKNQQEVEHKKDQ